MATSPAAGRGLVALFKRGWHEIPEVVGSSFIALIGVGLAMSAIVVYDRKDGDNRRFKNRMVIYRPDDPRAKTIKND